MMSASPAASRNPPGQNRRTWKLGGLLVLATLLAYSNSFQAPFVYDDVLAIPQNPTIRQLWPLTKVLLPQADGGLTVSGRPVLNLSFALNYAISGPQVWSYHLFNVLVHAGAGLLLFGIVRRTLGPWRIPGAPPVGGVAASASERAHDALGISFVIAALWALHPLHTQAVTYTVQRAESLTGFCFLLTLYAFVRAAQCHSLNDTGPHPSSGERNPACHPTGDAAVRRRRWLGVSVGACLLGMGTKETMATAPLLVLLYDRTFVAGGFLSALRARRGYYLALAGTWLLLAALVASTGGNRGGTAGFGVGVPLWAYPLTQFQAIARYLALSLWPHPLVFEYGTFWVQDTADILPYVALVGALLAATAAALWRRPLIGFLGAWFFVVLAPTSLTPGTIQMIVEHRMYLPLAAVVAGAVLLARRLPVRRPMAVAAVAAAAALGGLTYQRNHDYRSHVSLWADTVAKRPGNPRAHEGLAEAWTELGAHDLALKHRTEAIRLRPDESTAHHNLGLVRLDAGQWDDAVRSFRQALQLDPREPRTHNNLAIAYGRLGRHDEALAHYAEAVRLKPTDAQYHYNLGIALSRRGREAEAIREWEETLRLQPDHADAHFNLGTARARARQFDAAFVHYREAMRLRPEDAEYGITFAGALLLAEKAAESEAVLRRVVAVHPNSAEAHYSLGNALSAQGQPGRAIAAYESAVRLNPDHGRARYKLGNALIDLDRVAEAAAHYEAAVRLLPDDAEAHHNLGVAYARQERWNDARREFETALRLKPGYSDAQRNLAQLLGALRQNPP